eukprot:4900919-Amphidinium_carterae.1
MENRRKRKEISARTRHQHHRMEQSLEETPRRQPEENSHVVEVSDATDDSQPLTALAKNENSATAETSPLQKKNKNDEKVSRFMEMEYHGT